MMTVQRYGEDFLFICGMNSQGQQENLVERQAMVSLKEIGTLH